MIESLFPYILPVHIASVLSTLCIILRADSFALSWVRGKVTVLDVVRMHTLHRYVWYGLFSTITTGLFLFYPYSTYLLTHPPFQFKMGFICILIINGFFIGSLMHASTTQSFASLSNQKKALMLFSGALSTISWVGALIAANLLGL